MYDVVHVCKVLCGRPLAQSVPDRLLSPTDAGADPRTKNVIEFTIILLPKPSLVLLPRAPGARPCAVVEDEGVLKVTELVQGVGLDGEGAGAVGGGDGQGGGGGGGRHGQGQVRAAAAAAFPVALAVVGGGGGGGGDGRGLLLLRLQHCVDVLQRGIVFLKRSNYIIFYSEDNQFKIKMPIAVGVAKKILILDDN